MQRVAEPDAIEPVLHPPRGGPALLDPDLDQTLELIGPAIEQLVLFRAQTLHDMRDVTKNVNGHRDLLSKPSPCAKHSVCQSKGPLWAAGDVYPLRAPGLRCARMRSAYACPALVDSLDRAGHRRHRRLWLLPDPPPAWTLVGDSHPSPQ